MRPKSITLTMQVDRDGIAQAQTLGGAGNLTLNGALVSSSLYSHNTAQKIGIYSASDLSGVTFTVNGEGYSGTTGLFSSSLSEAVTGPNATTVETTNYFTKVTSVAAGGAVGSNVEVGPSDEAVSQPIPLDRYSEFNTGLTVVISGTINVDVQHTMSDIFNDSTPTWVDHDSLAAVTATTSGNYAVPVSATRLLVNSASNGATAKFQILQA